MVRPTYSVVIPVYNEEKRIPINIDAIFSFFADVGSSVEIIFVNDGSKDATASVLSEYQKKYFFTVINYSINRGKGYAIREGVKNATGDWVVFFDIDLATPLQEFIKLIQLKTDTDNIIIGSRRVEGAHIKKSESKLRTFLGQGFTKISNILVPNIADFTCGFKCFSRQAALTIFSRARIDRWGFDTELLYIAYLHKIAIKQIPVAWSHDNNSKVRVINAIFSSIKELTQMKINQLKGLYK